MSRLTLRLLLTTDWVWGERFEPSLDGYPLQTILPEGVEARRHIVLADSTQPQKATIPSLIDGQTVHGVVTIQFSSQTSI